MVVLGLETAGDEGSVGIIAEGRPLSEIITQAAFKHGEKVVSALDAALRLAAVDRGDLELIGVSAGPGSFTGLRIGMATAKGLARALRVPVVGVPTQEAYARRASFWDGPVWVLLPDRGESVYAARYRDGAPISPVRPRQLEDLCRELQATRPDRPTLLIGPGAERHRDRLRDRLPGAAVASATLNRPSGVEVAHLGRARYLERHRDEYEELEPLYLGPPRARPGPRPRASLGS